MAHFPANSGGEIAQEIATGITNLSAARYGKVVVVQFLGTTVTGTSVGTLPNDFPRPKIHSHAFGRWTSNDKNNLALLAMNANTRTIICRGYVANTSTSEVDGVATGQLIYITDD